MQSEFCWCRGLAANRFCRVCWVQKGQEDDDGSSPADDDAATAVTDATAAGRNKKAGKEEEEEEDRPPETLEQMTEHIHQLIKIGSP